MKRAGPVHHRNHGSAFNTTGMSGEERNLSLNGVSLIGSANGSTGAAFQAVNPVTGESVSPHFASASAKDVDRAAQLAQDAFPIYAAISGDKRGKFLRQIAAALETNGPEIVARAQLET